MRVRARGRASQRVRSPAGVMTHRPSSRSSPSGAAARSISGPACTRMRTAGRARGGPGQLRRAGRALHWCFPSMCTLTAQPLGLQTSAPVDTGAAAGHSRACRFSEFHVRCLASRIPRGAGGSRSAQAAKPTPEVGAAASECQASCAADMAGEPKGVHTAATPSTACSPRPCSGPWTRCRTRKERVQALSLRGQASEARQVVHQVAQRALNAVERECDLAAAPWSLSAE